MTKIPFDTPENDKNTLLWGQLAAYHFNKGFMAHVRGALYIDVPMTREELLAGGMTEKEIDIQEALGSTPTKSVLNDKFIKLFGGKENFINTEEDDVE